MGRQLPIADSCGLAAARLLHAMPPAGAGGANCNDLHHALIARESHRGKSQCAKSPGRPVPSSKLADVLEQRLRDRLAVRPRWRHSGRKGPDLSGELGLSFGDQNLANRLPPSLDLPPAREELRLIGFNAQTSFEQVTGNAVNPLAGVARHTAPLGAIDAVKLR